MLQTRTLIAATALVPLLAAGSLHAQCELSTFGPANELGVGYEIVHDDSIAAVSGDRRVYLYELQAGGWSQVAELQGSVATFDDRFGWQLALDGERLLVAAPFNSLQAFRSGVVYVFERVAGVWQETSVLTPTTPQPGLAFGCSIALSGNRLAVGSTCGNPGVQTEVHLFAGSGGFWTLEQLISSTDSGDLFGDELALEGDRLMVGAPRSDLFHLDGGAAHVFEHAAGSWVETQVLSGSGTANHVRFGASIDLQAERAVIGAPRQSTQSPFNGAAYVFEHDGASWVEDSQLLSPLSGAWNEFGTEVELEAERISVRRLRGGPDVFQRGAQGWEHLVRLRNFDDTYAYTSSDALAGDRILLGATDAAVDGSGFVRELQLAFDVSPYCLCSDRAWCADAFGGCDNSSGRGARIEFCGSTGVGADDLVLKVVQLPASQFGLLFMGGGAPRAPFGDGERCVGPGGVGVFRFPVQSSGVTGTMVLGPGIASTSAALFGAAGTIQAGSSWNFQAWYRDPIGPSCDERAEQPLPRGFNLSSALRVLFGS